MKASPYIDNGVPPATEADARAQADAWARDHGFASLDAYLDASWDTDRLMIQTPDGRIWKFFGRRKWEAPPPQPKREYAPGADELAAARRALGLEATEVEQ